MREQRRRISFGLDRFMKHIASMVASREIVDSIQEHLDGCMFESPSRIVAQQTTSMQVFLGKAIESDG
jgi:hypothetical protein